MRIRVHPIHTMVIHFPSALLPVDLVLSLMGYTKDNYDLAIAAFYCLAIGVIGGWLAIITGMFDLFRYILRAGDGLTIPFWHAAIQACVTACFTIVFAVEFKNAALISSPPVWLMVIKAILLVFMFAGNYLGGELIFRTVSKQFRS